MSMKDKSILNLTTRYKIVMKITPNIIISSYWLHRFSM